MHCSETWTRMSHPAGAAWGYPTVMVSIVVFSHPAGAAWGYRTYASEDASTFTNVKTGSRKVNGPKIGNERQWSYTLARVDAPSGYDVTLRQGRYLVTLGTAYVQHKEEGSALIFRLAAIVASRASKHG
jgi:hypothetical protein